MPRKNLRNLSSADLRPVPHAPPHRGGRAWESLRAAVRRRGFRVVGAKPPAPNGLDISVRARLTDLDVEGTRTLFLFNEAIRMDERQELPAESVRFARLLARIAGASTAALRRGALHGEVLDQLEALSLEESDEIGILRAAMGTGPDGLWIELSAPGGGPLREADGYELELAFEGGPVLRERLREGAALFRAGAALLESLALSDVAIDCSPHASVELEPMS